MGVRISGLNGFGGGEAFGGGDVLRVDGGGTGLPVGFVGGGELGLFPGRASGVAQYPQNTVPSGLSLPHCLHAGIRPPRPHRKCPRNP